MRTLVFQQWIQSWKYSFHIQLGIRAKLKQRTIKSRSTLSLEQVFEQLIFALCFSQRQNDGITEEIVQSLYNI